MKPKAVTLYTDGACENNPGRGGWAAILRAGTSEQSLSGGYRRTTNNRMELRAVIEGIKALNAPGTEITVVSDSRYVTEAIAQGWLETWVARQFRKSGGIRENADLWIELHALLRTHRVTTKWIRGHVGHQENEACDRLAVSARERPDLPVDGGFEDTAGTLVALGLSLL